MTAGTGLGENGSGTGVETGAVVKGGASAVVRGASAVVKGGCGDVVGTGAGIVVAATEVDGIASHNDEPFIMRAPEAHTV